MSLQPEPESHPVQRVKAPWPLKCESYLLFLNMKELPKGVYDQLEESWEGEEYGTFKGGLGAVMIVRYTDTPVGPYDELMLIPGNFTVPAPSSSSTPIKVPKKALRIARIYVSQRTTTYNGRLNWNIPKHLARFQFSPASGSPSPSSNPTTSSSPAPLIVRVFPPNSTPGDSTPPFFSCTLQPWRWVPAIPVNTAYVPISLLLAQPPCPAHPGQAASALLESEQKDKIDEYDVSERNEEAVAVGTERWSAVELKATSWARGCWVEMGGAKGKDGKDVGERVEEGRWWPQGVKPWRVGLWMEDGVFEFGVPGEWKL